MLRLESCCFFFATVPKRANVVLSLLCFFDLYMAPLDICGVEVPVKLSSWRETVSPSTNKWLWMWSLLLKLGSTERIDMCIYIFICTVHTCAYLYISKIHYPRNYLLQSIMYLTFVQFPEHSRLTCNQFQKRKLCSGEGGKSTFFGGKFQVGWRAPAKTRQKDGLFWIFCLEQNRFLGHFTGQ